MYHAFGRPSGGADPHHLFVSVEDLDRQLRLIKRFFRPIGLRDYVGGWESGRWPPRSLLITIDDGYSSTLTRAAPILAAHRVPAVLFVPPASLGSTSAWMDEMPDERILTPDELRSVTRFGIEVGVHGMDHRPLSGLDQQELLRQVEGSKGALAEIMGSDPVAFAYPQGIFDAAAVEAVKDAGYSVAFAVLQGGGRHAITRRPVTPRDSLPAFCAKLLPGFERAWAMTAGNRPLRRLAARALRQRPSATGGPGWRR